MNQDDYIQAIKDYIRKPAIEGSYKNAITPPGNRVTPQQKEIARWLASLSEKECQHIQYLLECAVDAAIFGYLCSLDGVTKITNESGMFHLIFKSEKGDCLLNAESSDYLHDIYKQ